MSHHLFTKISNIYFERTFSIDERSKIVIDKSYEFLIQKKTKRRIHEIRQSIKVFLSKIDLTWRFRIQIIVWNRSNSINTTNSSKSNFDVFLSHHLSKIWNIISSSSHETFLFVKRLYNQTSNEIFAISEQMQWRNNRFHCIQTLLSQRDCSNQIHQFFWLVCNVCCHIEQHSKTFLILKFNTQFIEKQYDRIKRISIETFATFEMNATTKKSISFHSNIFIATKILNRDKTIQFRISNNDLTFTFQQRYFEKQIHLDNKFAKEKTSWFFDVNERRWNFVLIQSITTQTFLTISRKLESFMK